MKTVLITGASGKIGTALRQFFQGKYHLRLLDLKPIANRRSDEVEFLVNLEDLDAVTGATAGADAIIHLGGVSKEEGWDAILPANIVGTFNVYEAARRSGVKRIVYASSSHTVGFYRRDEPITVSSAVRPDGRYGLSKAFGEGLARLYWDKYGVESLCLRIGAMTDKPLDVRRLGLWISPRDLAQLVELGIELPNLEFEIVFGISENARSSLDNSNAKRLGYRPQDRSEDYAEDVMRREPVWPVGDKAQMLLGGPYATAEFIGDPTKPMGV